MAASTERNYLREANFRRCRLCVWPSYDGLGFNLEKAVIPPHIIRTVESNSPAVAGGLRILDLILAVNNQDVSAADYKTVTQAIKNARDSNDRIDLLVIEKCYYEQLRRHGISFNPGLARTIEAPATMPRDYINFPKYTPRTCEIRITKTDKSFGFEVVNGNKDIGAFIQEVFPNTPASKTSLRKSDRILEINNKFVDNKKSRSILEKLAKAKTKRSVKLYVVDTNTYRYFQENQIPLTSKEFQKSTFSKPHQDDIRLCTINRANAGDTYGIELNFHKREQYHSINIITSRGPSSKNFIL
jgi:C-terminal processing protease CtpA/Prc